MGKRELELYDPFRRMRKAGEEMDDFFGSNFKPMKLDFGKSEARMPLINVRDAGKKLVISAEIPGVDKRGIKVDVDRSSLSIRAEKTSKKEEKGKNRYYSETSSQKFFRRIPLPANVSPQKAKHSYKDGVLEIVLPKASGGKA